MTEGAQKSNNHTDKWTRVITGVAGALILGLQGVNINETNGQTHLIQRLDIALEQQLSLTKEINQEGERVDVALDNQKKMIQSMEAVLQNQSVTLDLLRQEQPKK